MTEASKKYKYFSHVVFTSKTGDLSTSLILSQEDEQNNYLIVVNHMGCRPFMKFDTDKQYELKVSGGTVSSDVLYCFERIEDEIIFVTGIETHIDSDGDLVMPFVDRCPANFEDI